MIELDVHAHLAPINAGQLASLPGVQWDAGAEALVLDGHRVGIKDLFHPERLVAWMDKRGVQRAWVSIPPPLYRQHLDLEAARVWTRYVNEGLLQASAAHPDRLQALLHLPLEHPDLIGSWLSDPLSQQFAGLALAAGGHPRICYSDSALDPLWQWLHERRHFVFLHPGACGDTRLARFYLENLLGNPVETAIAASHLVMGGIPQRFPHIRFCLAHAGGAFPAVCGRLQRGFDTRRPDVPDGVELPLQAARRFYADGIAHHPQALALAREIFGADHILFGSDWPFPMGIPDD